MTSLPWPPPSTCSSNLHLSPQQRCQRTLPELLTAVAELLTRQQPDHLPILHCGSTIQQVTHIEFRVLEQLEYELAALTPVAWGDIFRRRHSLWQQQQQRSQNNSHTQPQPCSSFRIPRRLRQSGCRGSRSEFPVLMYFCKPVRSAQRLGSCAAQHVCSAVNSLPALSPRPSPVRSRLSGGSLITKTRCSHVFSMLLSLCSVSPLCSGHCVQFRTVRSGSVWES